MSWTQAKIAGFLDRSVIPVRLSFLAADGSPVVASHWFRFENGSLWCAVQDGSFAARRLAIDDRCAFEVAGDQPPYHGVRGRGRAVLHPGLGEQVLRGLIDRYLGHGSPNLERFLLSRATQEIAIEIVPDRWSSWDYSDRMT